jgi:hypothetical protein
LGLRRRPGWQPGAPPCAEFFWPRISGVTKKKGRKDRARAKKCRAFGKLNLNFCSPRASVARAAAPLPSLRLRLALIKRLVAASRRNEPLGPVPKWTSRQARLDKRELIRMSRLASHDALNDNQAAEETRHRRDE